MEKNSDILVEVKGLSKKFTRSLKRGMWYGLKDVGSALLGMNGKRSELRSEEFWAVKNIDFTLRRGECLGLIGHNGAGKSTLLKMLNGLIRPDKGSITMRGKVNALIELGAGFNPILTGRENIYISGQLRGFSIKEIDKKLKAILDFAEIGEFVDSPVQNYSSGMKVRLGFAVAAQMEPDVLLIDEVLAVGDLGFKLKCFNVIDTLLEKSAVIFVSHTMQQVSRMCSGIMLLEKGEIAYFDENVSAGIENYYSKFSNETKSNKEYFAGDNLSLTEVEFSGQPIIQGKIYSIDWLQDLVITLKLRAKINYNVLYLGVSIMDKEQRPVGICMNESGIDGKNVILKENGFIYYSTQLVIPKINLSKGIYSVNLSVSEKFRQKPILRIQSILQFQVCSKHAIWSPIEFEGHWS